MPPNSTEIVQAGHALSLHEEMSNSISSLLTSLSHISLGLGESNKAALQKVSQHLLLLKHNQRCLGHLQGIQLTEISGSLLQKLERVLLQKQEVDQRLTILSNRDKSGYGASSIGQSTAHLLTVARQGLINPDTTELDTDISVINAYLKGTIESPDGFDFTDPDNHLNNLKSLHFEIDQRKALLEQLKQITAQKEEVAQRLTSLSNRRIELKRHLDAIHEHVNAIKSSGCLG